MLSGTVERKHGALGAVRRRAGERIAAAGKDRIEHSVHEFCSPFKMLLMPHNA